MGTYIRDLMNMSVGVKRFILTESLLGIGVGIFSLVFNLHLLEMGFNEAEIGEINSIGILVMGFFSIPIGLLANKLGRKKLLVGGLLIMGIGYAGVGFGEAAYSFYLAQIVISFGITLLINSEIQLLFNYSRSKREETQAYSMLFSVFTFFTGVGTLIAGFIPKLFDQGTSTYQSSLIISALLIIISASSRAILLPREELEDKTIKVNFSYRDLFKQFQNKSLWIFSFFTFIIGASFSILVPFFNIIVKFRMDWGDERLSLLLTVNGFFLFLGSFIMPYALEKLGIHKLYLYSFVSNIIFSGILFMVLPIPLFIFTFLLRSGTFTMLNNLIESQTMQAIDEADRNLYAGLKTVLRSIGSSISSYIAGIILATQNYFLPFLIAGILLTFGLIYYLVMIKSIYEIKLKDNFL